MRTPRLSWLVVAAIAAGSWGVAGAGIGRVAAQTAPAQLGTWPKADFHDSHFHLTNYVQEGIDVPRFLAIMGTRVGRSTLFGIPLQQTWFYPNTGDFAPTYYLQSDSPLYYYSFTDAVIAQAYLSLTKEERARFDPMITGFNPADMYAADHIRRVLTMYPGVFTGIGEFSIHKEFVSAKIPGETASLTNPALDRILAFAAEAGLVVILHNDIDMPFAKQDAEPVYLTQVKALLKQGRAAELLGTIEPDLVLHLPGQPLHVQRVFDFKFPCVNTDKPMRWRDQVRNQGAAYEEALRVKPSRVQPHIGVIE